MAIARLEIDLVAKLAKFEGDLKKAAQASEQAAGDIAKAFGIAKAAAVGLVGAFSVSALTQFVRATANGLDKLNDLADATGSSIANLSALEDTAARTGTSIDTVGDALVKLNKSLGDARPDNDAGRALKLIGLNAKELRDLDPADAIVKVARALNGFENDQRKAAIVQELFGKSIREVAPLLNDLAERGKGVAKVTEEQAKQAEKFNQELSALSKNATDAARNLLGSLLPAVNSVFEAGNKGGLRGAIDQIGELLGLGKEYYATRNLRIAADDLRELELRVATQPKGPGLTALTAELEEKRKRYESVRALYLQVRELDKETPSFRPSQNYGDAFKATLPDFKVDPDVEKASKQYQKLAADIGAAAAAMSEEIVAGDKLNPAQQLRLKITEALSSAEFRFTAAQRASLEAALKSSDALGDQLELRKTMDKVRQNSAAIEERALSTIDREFQARLQSNEALREQAAEYGKTEAEIELLRLARLEEIAAQEELLILTLQNVEGTENETAARQRNADALRDQVRLRRQLLERKEADERDPLAGANKALDEYLQKAGKLGESTKEAVGSSIRALEDDLTESLRKGEFSVKKFFDTVISEAIRLRLVRPLLEQALGLFGGGSTGVSGGAGTVAGGGGIRIPGRANGGPVSAGGMYEVNERGLPELLSVAGKDYLMMGSTGGRVSNVAAASGPSIGTLNVGSGMSRGEVFAAIRQGIDAAMGVQGRQRAFQGA